VEVEVPVERPVADVVCGSAPETGDRRTLDLLPPLTSYTRNLLPPLTSYYHP
jgi:hypothetical protein